MANTLGGAGAAVVTGRYTRRELLARSLAVGAGACALSAVGGVVTAQEAVAAAQPITTPLNSDLDVLNYALTLEYLEAEAYKTAVGSGALSGRALSYFRAFGADEQAHVDALVATIRQLGGTPVAKPAFNFAGVPTDAPGIVKFFQEVESVGVSAYLGAAPLLKNVDLLEAALKIHAVEAEHASALADLFAPGTDTFAPFAFQPARTPAEVLQIVAPFLATTGAPAMPGMPNTGGGYGAATGNPQRESLAALGLVGAGALALATLSRRQLTRAEERTASRGQAK